MNNKALNTHILNNPRSAVLGTYLVNDADINTVCAILHHEQNDINKNIKKGYNVSIVSFNEEKILQPELFNNNLTFTKPSNLPPSPAHINNSQFNQNDFNILIKELQNKYPINDWILNYLQIHNKMPQQTVKKSEDKPAINEQYTASPELENSFAAAVESVFKTHNTHFFRLKNTLHYFPENAEKDSKQMDEITKTEIYSLMAKTSTPQITHFNNLLKKSGIPENRFDTLAVNSLFKNWQLKQYPRTLIGSPYFDIKNTIFELNDYFVQILQKGDKYGLRAVWESDKPGVQFLIKDPNFNIEQYKSLNEEGRSFHACINNQFVRGTGFTYLIDTLIKDPIGPGNFYMQGNESYINENENWHLRKALKQISDDNSFSSELRYISFPNAPYKEYVIKSKETFDLNCKDILFNGEGKQYKTRKNITHADYIKAGYEVLNRHDYYRLCEEYQDKSCGKWKEITEHAFKEYMKNKGIKTMPENNNGFFSSEMHKGDLKHYYAKYNNRYFTSLQREKYDQSYILNNLKSNITRFPPLKDSQKRIKEYLNTFFPEISEKLYKNGKTTLIPIDYHTLKNEHITVKEYTRTGLDGIDGKQYKHTIYSYDLNNQISEKTSKNIYDKFASKYITDISKLPNANIESIKKELQNMSFKGDLQSLAENLYANKNAKWSNLITAENLLHDNSSLYKIIPPTLNQISVFVATKNIDIDRYIKPTPKTQFQEEKLYQSVLAKPALSRSR